MKTMQTVITSVILHVMRHHYWQGANTYSYTMVAVAGGEGTNEKIEKIVR